MYDVKCFPSCISQLILFLYRALPIESQYPAKLADNLNAEVALGTVTSVEEGMRWLSYTFLFQRLRKNPLV